MELCRPGWLWTLTSAPSLQPHLTAFFFVSISLPSFQNLNISVGFLFSLLLFFTSLLFSSGLFHSFSSFLYYVRNSQDLAGGGTHLWGGCSRINSVMRGAISESLFQWQHCVWVWARCLWDCLVASGVPLLGNACSLQLADSLCGSLRVCVDCQNEACILLSQ